MKFKLPQITALIVAIGGLIGASTPLVMYVGDRITIGKIEKMVKEEEDKLSVKYPIDSNHPQPGTWTYPAKPNSPTYHFGTNNKIFRVDYTNGQHFIRTKNGFVKVNK